MPFNGDALKFGFNGVTPHKATNLLLKYFAYGGAGPSPTITTPSEGDMPVRIISTSTSDSATVTSRRATAQDVVNNPGTGLSEGDLVEETVFHDGQQFGAYTPFYSSSEVSNTIIDNFFDNSQGASFAVDIIKDLVSVSNTTEVMTSTSVLRLQEMERAENAGAPLRSGDVGWSPEYEELFGADILSYVNIYYEHLDESVYGEHGMPLWQPEHRGTRDINTSYDNGRGFIGTASMAMITADLVAFSDVGEDSDDIASATPGTNLNQELLVIAVQNAFEEAKEREIPAGEIGLGSFGYTRGVGSTPYVIINSVGPSSREARSSADFAQWIYYEAMALSYGHDYTGDVDRSEGDSTTGGYETYYLGVDEQRVITETDPDTGEETGDTTLKYWNVRELTFALSVLSRLLDKPSSEFVSDALQDSNGQFSYGINLNPMMPDRVTSPSLSAIVLPTMQHNIAVRDTDSAALFMSAIPTVEMSRCSPLLNLRFNIDTPPLDQYGVVSQPHLVGFLGNLMPWPGTANFSMVNSMPESMIRGSDENLFTDYGVQAVSRLSHNSEDAEMKNYGVQKLNVASMGMEVFTSPQTLVNMQVNTGRFGRLPVLDPTQPFMTLESATIREYSSGYGLIGFKKATVTLTLHDRSRLHEIAPFISPRGFGAVTATLEYGWSHPDSDPMTGSPYGIFLNSLRKVERYRLIRGNYSMDQSGQIKVTLEMGITGGEDVKRTHFATGQYIMAAEVDNVFKDIFDIQRRAVQRAVSTLSPDVMQEQSMAIRNASSEGLMVRRTLYVIALEMRRKLLNSNMDPSMNTTDLVGNINIAEDIVSTYNSLYDACTQRPQSDTISAQHVCLGKLNSLNPVHPQATPDPFLANFSIRYSVDGGGTVINAFSTETELARSDPGSESSAWVSLAKVFMCLVGRPLAATHRYDEVQVVFYGFNDSAGCASRQDISQFPISYEQLALDMTNEITRNPNLKVGQIIDIISDYVDNPMHPAYGLTHVYEAKDAYDAEIAASSQAVVDGTAAAGEERASQEEPFDLGYEINRALYHMGLPRPEFRVPRMKVLFEALPARSAGAMDLSREILRIHVFDRNVVRNVGEKFALDCATSGKMMSLYQDAADSMGGSGDLNDRTQSRRMLSAFIGSSQNILGRMESPEGSNEEGQTPDPWDQFATYYNDALSRDAVHAFVKSRVPSILFGSSFSPIDSLTINGRSSGQVFDALLSEQWSGNTDSDVNQGSGENITELRVVPVDAKASGLGCTSIHYGQQFYLDLRTGTTADNIFVVSDVTHTLSPGTFKTDITFNPAGAYGTVDSVRSKVLSTLNAIRAASGVEGQPVAQDPEVDRRDENAETIIEYLDTETVNGQSVLDYMRELGYEEEDVTEVSAGIEAAGDEWKTWVEENIEAIDDNNESTGEESSE